MRPIGPTWAEDAGGASLVGHSFGADGLIEVHDVQNRLRRIYADDNGSIRDLPIVDTGAHRQVAETQIAAIKTALAAHDPTKPAPMRPDKLKQLALIAELTAALADPTIPVQLKGVLSALKVLYE